MTSDNAEASSVVTNNKKPSVLRREMVNEKALFRDRDNEIEVSDAARSLPCDNEDAHFDSKGDSFDATTFTFQPPEECAVLTSSVFMYTTKQKWTVALLKLQDDINAPDYAIRLIIEWARSAKNDGYSFFHQVVSHGIQMLNFCSSVYRMPPFFAHLFNPCSVWMVPQVK